MSPELRQFLTEWLAWAEDENPDRRFRRQMGLCYNYVLWRAAKDLRPSKELSNLFATNCTPFNVCTPYFQEGIASACHLNPARRNWVRQQLGKNNETHLVWLHRMERTS